MDLTAVAFSVDIERQLWLYRDGMDGMWLDPLIPPQFLARVSLGVWLSPSSISSLLYTQHACTILYFYTLLGT